MNTKEILQKAVEAKTKLMTLSTSQKREALDAMATQIERDADIILEANEVDVFAARGNISDVMIDRLTLNKSRIADMCEGIRNVAKLDDPIGITIEERTLDSGLNMKKVSVPMGVVAIIYESRPNVTSDAAALCLMSGNVCVLRGGKEAYNTSKAIVNSMRKALWILSEDQSKNSLSEDFINIIDDTSRESASELMKARGMVDLLIPRGGAGLIKACVEGAQVPVIETGTGICSVYVDKAADLNKAVKIVANAKTQRPSVCNAAEQLIVHRDVAVEFLPLVKKVLCDERAQQGGSPVEQSGSPAEQSGSPVEQSASSAKQSGSPVELRLDEEAAKIIDGTPASQEDFDTEFLDYILAVKVVSSIEEACAHIEAHSTHHSEAIVTEDKAAADYFTSHLDSAAVYVNASTRFTDGGMFGLGCEMGISTQKLHARGPMGLRELTSYKYIITGDGQIRE